LHYRPIEAVQPAYCQYDVPVAQLKSNIIFFVTCYMQGRKDFTPKLFYELSLDCLVPQEDFYRKVNQHLELHFLYKATAPYYGREGQQSIDPVVFFKILLVGYLNNINSDRALLRYCADSLSIGLFLGYDLDEELPWHSTISRTRQLFGEEVFLSLFQKVSLKLGEVYCFLKTHLHELKNSFLSHSNFS